VRADRRADLVAGRAAEHDGEAAEPGSHAPSFRRCGRGRKYPDRKIYTLNAWMCGCFTSGPWSRWSTRVRSPTRPPSSGSPRRRCRARSRPWSRPWVPGCCSGPPGTSRGASGRTAGVRAGQRPHRGSG
jgi:hypothetical protein